MRPRLRHLIYLLLFVGWLLVMSLPLLSVVLATQRTIQLGQRSQTHLRLFLVQEQTSEGVGLEWARRQSAAPGCVQTRLIYLMWKGDGDNATYCQCYNQDGAIVRSEVGACTPP